MQIKLIKRQSLYLFWNPLSAMHAQQMREATLALSGGVTRTAPLPIPGPRWPWLLGFVIVAAAGLVAGESMAGVGASLWQLLR